ncbi:MAG TPA: type II toxin-antitoxin system VapC family toxin [Aldersonia sp.]
MIVVDAAVWVRALIDDGPSGIAARRVLTADQEWVAPAHMPIEVLRTIRRYETAHLLTSEQADLHAAQVLDAEVGYAQPQRWLLAAVWDRRHNISPYDAPYVALAQYHGIPLVTFDDRLARAAGDSGIPVLVPGP